MAEEMRLSEAIRKLRVELEEAQQEGEHKPLRFVPKSIALELGLVLKAESEGLDRQAASRIPIVASAAHEGSRRMLEAIGPGRRAPARRDRPPVSEREPVP